MKMALAGFLPLLHIDVTLGIKSYLPAGCTKTTRWVTVASTG
jgi:hypothetical protein